MSQRQFALLGAAVLLAGFFGVTAVSAPAKAPADDVNATKVKLAREIVQQMTTRLKNQEGDDLEDMELWLQHLLDAELAVAKTKAARLAAYQANVDRTSELAKIMNSYFQTGQRRESDALAADFYRLEAETRLAQAKAD